MDYMTGTAAELGPALLRALGRYRHQVFVEHLGWRLPDARQGMEWDRFDTPQTVHVLALDPHGAIQGCARLLPTTGPYLLSEVFPALLGSRPCPRASHIWELSRFAALDLTSVPTSGHTLGSPTALALLRRAMSEAQQRGASELVSVSPVAIERILRRGGFPYTRLAPPACIEGHQLFACGFALGSSRVRITPKGEVAVKEAQVQT